MNYVYYNAYHSAFAGFAGTYINPHACCPPLPDGIDFSVFPPTYNEGVDFIPGNGATHVKITHYIRDIVNATGPNGEPLYFNAWLYPQTNPYNPPILFRDRAPDYSSLVTVGDSELVVDLDSLLPDNDPRNNYGHTIIFSYSATGLERRNARAGPPFPVIEFIGFIIEHTCPDTGRAVPLKPGGLPPVIMPDRRR